MQFAKSTCKTNVIVMSAPLRFDLQPFSCVNKEVAMFNRKLLTYDNFQSLTNLQHKSK